jgi:hypothetical protein
MINTRVADRIVIKYVDDTYETRPWHLILDGKALPMHRYKTEAAAKAGITLWRKQETRRTA